MHSFTDNVPSENGRKRQIKGLVSKSVGGESEPLKKGIAQLTNKNSTLRATSDLDDSDHYVEYASWHSEQQRL